MFDVMKDPYQGILYRTAAAVPMEPWEWPNFTPQELACKGTGYVMIDPDAMDKLQALRDYLGKPLYINSAFRSQKHNTAVGGAKGSMHRQARAFDVSMHNHDPAEFEAAARAVGFTGFGFYPPKNGGYNFIHVDTGRARFWGERWSSKTDDTPTSVDDQDTDAPAPKAPGVRYGKRRL